MDTFHGLLGELVTIVMMLEYALPKLAILPCRMIKVFCDSQSAFSLFSVSTGRISVIEM